MNMYLFFNTIFNTLFQACPYRLEVYVERTGRREPRLKVTGIDSLQRKELVQEIGQSVIEKVGHFYHLNYFNCAIS